MRASLSPGRKHGYGTLHEDQTVGAFQKKLDQTAQLARLNDDLAGEVLDEMRYQRETLDSANEDLTVMESISATAKTMIRVIQDKSNRKEVTLKGVSLQSIDDMTELAFLIIGGNYTQCFFPVGQFHIRKTDSEHFCTDISKQGSPRVFIKWLHLELILNAKTSC